MLEFYVGYEYADDFRHGLQKRSEHWRAIQMHWRVWRADLI